jgi:hypothetical protein
LANGVAPGGGTVPRAPVGDGPRLERIGRRSIDDRHPRSESPGIHEAEPLLAGEPFSGLDPVRV